MIPLRYLRAWVEDMAKKDLKAYFVCPECSKKWHTMFEPWATVFKDHCTNKPCLVDRVKIDAVAVDNLPKKYDNTTKFVSGGGELPLVRDPNA